VLTVERDLPQDKRISMMSVTRHLFKHEGADFKNKMLVNECVAVL